MRHTICEQLHYLPIQYLFYILYNTIMNQFTHSLKLKEVYLLRVQSNNKKKKIDV